MKRKGPSSTTLSGASSSPYSSASRSFAPTSWRFVDSSSQRRTFIICGVGLLVLFCVYRVFFDSIIPFQVTTSTRTTKLSQQQQTLRNSKESYALLTSDHRLQKNLPTEYPNGVQNRFSCDLPALRYQCDLDGMTGCQAYPQLFPVNDLLKNWSPDAAHKRPTELFSSICRFNISSPYEYQLAQVFHQMEVPFIAYGIPDLTSASTRWTDEYLTEKLDPNELYKIHVSNNSHFMYYSKSNALGGELPTYDSQWWTYPQFTHAIKQSKRFGPNEAHRYYYLMLKARDLQNRAKFVYDDLPFLDPSRNDEESGGYGDFFIRDRQVALQRGIMCRLGMRGIITEGHIDAGFNMIAMVRGAKRYILSPPSVCSCLELITTGQSARHTKLDWSNLKALPEHAKKCPATEVIVEAGDVLYVPSYWYHHIVSLDESIQCNSRSGVIVRPDVASFLAKCGF